ncbi:hypothetical protein HMPREF3038_01422 [Akkermansia sp. KLE1797]|nr:hypothetical protein HMPREF3038_01422 [Akkermansia sp. KLE1797]KXU55434.1 hypothetical protein HMPREF3039_00331 [Akkermansia sp. KLE1798]KZA03477.1 hypothetical protein HMPREF1326_02906 [Akkermansia sp. KLE1605]
MLTYYAAVSSRLPTRVAVHFNEYGIPTRFADKHSMDALLGFIGLGILGFLIGKVLRLIILLPIHFSRNENNRRIGAKMATYVEFFLVVLFSYLCLAIQKTSLTNTVSLGDTAKVIFIGINIFLLLMVNVCPKIAPNKWLGIRTPYVFSSDEAWVRIQRLGGRFLFCGSLFNILVTLFLPGSFPVIFIFNMASLLLQSLVIFLWNPHRNRSEIPPSSGSGGC